MSALAECAARTDPSHARFTVRTLPATSTTSILSESMRMISSDHRGAGGGGHRDRHVGGRSGETVSGVDVDSVSSMDFPVTSIRSGSTLMICPTPIRAESVTSTPVSDASSASARAPAGSSSAECPKTPVIATNAGGYRRMPTRRSNPDRSRCRWSPVVKEVAAAKEVVGGRDGCAAGHEGGDGDQLVGFEPQPPRPATAIGQSR